MIIPLMQMIKNSFILVSISPFMFRITVSEMQKQKRASRRSNLMILLNNASCRVTFMLFCFKKR